jgi:hypothetical protein
MRTIWMGRVDKTRSFSVFKAQWFYHCALNVTACTVINSFGFRDWALRSVRPVGQTVQRRKFRGISELWIARDVEGDGRILLWHSQASVKGTEKTTKPPDMLAGHTEKFENVASELTSLPAMFVYM